MSQATFEHSKPVTLSLDKSASGSGQQATKSAFDESKLPASRIGGTHCTPLDSNYGVLGQDDTFRKDEKVKGFGVGWGERLKGKVARF